MMTEQEWLDADSLAVQDYFHDNLSPRTVRLFVCACVRRIWHMLDNRSAMAVEVAERLADRQATEQELAAADEGAAAALLGLTTLSSAEAAALQWPAPRNLVHAL
jgi:hypothetical protein